MNKRSTRYNGMLPVVILLVVIMIFGIKIIGELTNSNDIQANLNVTTLETEIDTTSKAIIESASEGLTETVTQVMTEVQTEAPTKAPTEATTQAVDETTIDESSYYYTANDVALYLYTFGHLPPNYITKNQAKEMGWVADKGNLWDVAKGMVIGGDYFGNYEDKLAEATGRKYYECDVNYEGGYRNAYRIVFSNDGLIYYTKDHYETFTRLY